MRCAVFSVLILTSCATVNQAYEEFQSKSDTTKGAVLGGTAGAVVGTVLGSQVGNPVEGFALGSAAGAGVGALIGSAIESQRAKEEQAEYERQVASMNVQKEQYIHRGSEYVSGTRRERVAPGDRYFHRLASLNQNIQKTAPSYTGSGSLANTVADQVGDQSGPTMGTIGQDANFDRQGAGVASAASRLSPSANNQAVVALQPSAERSGQKAVSRLNESAGTTIKQDQTEVANLESGILNKNPYASAEERVSEAKDNREQRGDLTSTASLTNPNSGGEISSANQIQAVHQQSAQPLDSQDSSAQTDRANNVASSVNQAQVSSACPEGDAELRKAAEATEFSGKLFHTRRAVRLCNNYIPGKLALARLYIELKRYEDAQFELENLLKIDPSNREAMELLNKTKQMM